MPALTLEEKNSRLAAYNKRMVQIENAATLNDGKFCSDADRDEHSALMAQVRALRDEPTLTPRRSHPNSASPLADGMDGAAAHLPGTAIEHSSNIAPRGTQLGRARNFRGVVNGRTPEQRARSLGLWAMAAIGKVIPARQSLEAESFVANQFGPRALMMESDATSGAHFLVPEEFQSDLISLMEQYGVARRLFRLRRMTSDTRTDPLRSSGLTASFIGESEAGSESNATWGQTMLSAKLLMCLTRITAQLSADSALDIGDTLAGEIAQAFANKEDECGFNGTGASTYGGIVGVRQALQTAAGSPTTTSAGGVIVGAGNAYSELLLTDFEAVAGILPAFADTPNATWVCSRAFFFGTMVRLALAAGGVTAREISDGQRGRPTFMGYPVTFSQVMPTTAANSQLCALLGDFTVGASFGDREQIGVMFSEHATVGGQSVFERNEIAIRGTERFDIVVHGVGTSSVAGPIVGLQTLNS